jgi:putative transposase
LIADAVAEYGKPDILNTDQGSQYTSETFSQYVIGQGIRLSMDGKERATDNPFIERLWRTVKYENARFNSYQDRIDMVRGLDVSFSDYNSVRRHSSINNLTPKAVFYCTS